MPIDTVLDNVGEYYSAHYLDAGLPKDVQRFMKSWDEKRNPSKRLRGLGDRYFAAKCQALEHESATARWKYRDDAMAGWHSHLLTALGYVDRASDPFPVDGGTAVVPVVDMVYRQGKPWLGIVETAFCLPEGAAPDQFTLDDPLELAPFDDQVPAATEPVKLLKVEWEKGIARIFAADEPPRWVLFLAGSKLYLFDRHTYAQCRYLSFDLDDAYGRKEAAVFEVLAAFLAKDTLCPDADGTVFHDEIEQRSHQAAYAVSESLQFAVREAIEKLGNEWVESQRAKHEGFREVKGKNGVETTREELAERLRHEALIYVYRMLFCLYAEAHGGELGVLPMNDEQYRMGYSFEGLRDLEFVPLTETTAAGTYFHSRLKKLFQLIYQGFDEGEGMTKTFRLHPLMASLFDPNATPLLDDATLRNGCLQAVVRHLSIARDPETGRRGRVNYAQLGINQLGAVYEGLLSFRGMFAHEELIKVVRAGDNIESSKTASWFVPKGRMKEFEGNEIVRGKDNRPRIYKTGEFVLYLNAIDREKSASYYTPECLTRCLVKEALRELLKDYTAKDADKILSLSVCEPAMGSGAFLNEVTNQLAEKYLELKQEQIGEEIEPSRYQDELRRVKHYIASQCVYGVDLNATAVELGGLSLWLNSMHRLLLDRSKDAAPTDPDLFVPGATPWFGLRLRSGNSLIGARRAVWKSADLKKGNFYGKNTALPRLLRSEEERGADEVYHFLVFDEDMMPSASERQMRQFWPKECERVKAWHKRNVTSKWSDDEIDQALKISQWIDEVWIELSRARVKALEQTKCTATVWPLGSGTVEARKRGPTHHEQEKVREQSEGEGSAFRRLKVAMDAWCALYFYSVQAKEELPTRSSWLGAMELLFVKEAPGTGHVARLSKQVDAEVSVLFHGGKGRKIDADTVVEFFPWLSALRGVSQEQRFFHWELMFPEVLGPKGRGGFDLVVGNPPWVDPGWTESAAVSQFNPLVGVRNFRAAAVRSAKEVCLKRRENLLAYSEDFRKTTGGAAFLNSRRWYWELQGGRTNLYKNFIALSWFLGCGEGVAALLHPEGVYDEVNAPTLRKEYYKRLKGHYQFGNVKSLFVDVHNSTTFSINIARTRPGGPNFLNVVNLFEPRTLEACFSNRNEHEPLPLIKDEENQWEVRGHIKRIVEVTEEQLRLFARLTQGNEAEWESAAIPQAHSRDLVNILKKYATAPKLRESGIQYSVSMYFNETTGQDAGQITRQDEESFVPETLGEVVLTGPLIHVGNPIAKTAKTVSKNMHGFDDVDLTDIPEDFLPRTVYRPGDKKGKRDRFNELLASVGNNSTLSKPTIGFWRFAFRNMHKPGDARSLIGAIVPPGVSGVNTLNFLAVEDLYVLIVAAGTFISIPGDFLVKAKGRTHVYEEDLVGLPLPSGAVGGALSKRVLRLMCLTRAFAPLWKNEDLNDIADENWTRLAVFSNSKVEHSWSDLNPNQWDYRSPLRTDFSRRQALLEIDVLVALSIGLTLDELLLIYRLQFPVMRKYELTDEYDAKGRRLPSSERGTPGASVLREARKQHDGKSPLTVSWPIDNGNTTVTKTFYPPFTHVDREEDYRQAYKVFSQRFGLK